MKNNQILAKIQFSTDEAQSSQTIIIELNKGDDVSVRNAVIDRSVMGDRYSSFSGFLLYSYEYTHGSQVVGK